MVLGDVEETHTVVEIDEETFEEIIKVRPNFGKFFRRSKLFVKRSTVMVVLTVVAQLRPCPKMLYTYLAPKKTFT
jgi:hypothetical protein